ncbi:glycosyl hydrolase [Rhodovulum imhoffii]|nr:glycosyl hydrolase [Rhodovulum imhoffii]
MGDKGTVFHFDGTVWARMNVPVPVPLHALWGNNRNELWAVGWMGAILRYDGRAWHRVRGCRVDGAGKYAAHPENTPLFAIDGQTGGTAFTVGDDGMILRWSGVLWEAENSGTRAHLRAVLCLSDGRVLAAGHGGIVLLRSLEGDWNSLACSVSTGFTAALEIAPGTVLLAGGRYFAAENGFRGDLVLLEEDRFERLFPDASLPRLRDLAVMEDEDGVLVAGDRGMIRRLTEEGPAPVESGTSHDLHGLVPAPGGGVLAVGDFGTILSNGPPPKEAPAICGLEKTSSWRRLDSGTEHTLWGVWRDPKSGTAYACGESGTVLVEDRDKWVPLPKVGPVGLRALARAPEGGLLAAGEQGKVYHFDGRSWRCEFDLMPNTTLLALWSDDAGTVFAAGDEGLILHRDSAGWRRAVSGTKNALYGLWGPDDRHLLAVGDFGLVLRWNGTDWKAFNAGTERFLFGVWGRGLNDIFVVGLAGTLGHFDGTRWRISAARARHDLLAVAGTEDAAFAVGSSGAAMSHDGNRWISEPTGVESGLRAVTAVGGVVLAAGDGGCLLRREAAD